MLVQLSLLVVATLARFSHDPSRVTPSLAPTAPGLTKPVRRLRDRLKPEVQGDSENWVSLGIGTCSVRVARERYDNDG
jgi:hypothetical protein